MGTQLVIDTIDGGYGILRIHHKLMSDVLLVRIGISHRKEIRCIVVAAAGFWAGELRLHRRNQTASVRSPSDEDG